MDFIKEVIYTFNKKDKEEFERFLTRKQPKNNRRDLTTFRLLFDMYQGKEVVIENMKGSANYHALRKRLSKELDLFLMLKEATENFNDILGLHKVVYFINLKKYDIAWQLLEKEELKRKGTKFIEEEIKIQRLKLEILPYFNGSQLEKTHKRLYELQKLQYQKDRLQVSFIQIQNSLKDKIFRGEYDDNYLEIEKILNKNQVIEMIKADPNVLMQIIRMVRAKFLLDKKYKQFAFVAQKYYEQMFAIFKKEQLSNFLLSELEFTMAHAYFRVRKFSKSQFHLSQLNELMQKDKVLLNAYGAKYISIKSSIDVLEGHLAEAILEHETFINEHLSKLTAKDKLTLNLNLVAYYCCEGAFKKAGRLLLIFQQSDAYYQNLIGMESMVRKELIRVIVQVELGNIDLALNILQKIQKQYATMFEREEYQMVPSYVKTIIQFIDNPNQNSKIVLKTMEEATDYKDSRLFDDPKLLSFYSWLKSKILGKNLYETLLQEYQNSILNDT
jgi:hypothetical protein